MAVTPVRLLNLYPRYWRERYGEEFLALLESTDLTLRLVLDVVRAAARERLTRTVVGRAFVGLAITGAALVCAWGGHTLTPPSWSVVLGSALELLTAAVMLRLLIVILRRGPRVSAGELRIWLLALFVGAVGSEWASLVSHPGIGVAADSMFLILGRNALMVTNCLIQLLLAGDGYPNDPRLVPLVPRSTAPPARPLGLFDPRPRP